jgi:hypothetical protein
MGSALPAQVEHRPLSKGRRSARDKSFACVKTASIRKRR